MVRQIKWLLRVSLCNLLGWNEFRYTKDEKKKNRYRLMGALWCLVIMMLMGYVGMTTYGLIYMEMGDYVPAVLGVLVAGVVFVFTMLKAGPVLFEKGAYEKQITLPFTVRSIIAGRFLSMYFTDMCIGLLVMLPGMTVYGIAERPGVTFYLYGLMGILFLPMLPLTLASVVGALITGISSRWRQQNLAAILLTMVFVCVILFGSFSISGMDESQLEDLVWQLAPLLEEQIGHIYPPALWLSKAMIKGNLGMLLLFLAVSVLSFVLFLEVLRPFYGTICSLLGVHQTKGNYRMKGLKVRSAFWSMVDREIRRYFSSVVYVTNTLVGNVLMVLLAAAILIMGTDDVEKALGIPGIVSRALPVLLGMLPAMMPMTSCAISMEGKQWWMMRTLPVSGKSITRSMVFANILVAFPFYLVSELLLVIALKPDVVSLLWLLAVPAVYIIFSARIGIVINCKFPVFDWENETRVVKQSASTLVAMLVGMVTGIVPLVALIALAQLPAYVIYLVFVLVLAAAIAALECIDSLRKV
jgi:ABC-2 type transport system permease protein